MEKLAIKGGLPVRKNKFPGYNTIGRQEIEAVERVMRSGVLSKYLGSWGDGFLGGREVQAFEKEWAEYFKVRHAIAVNSNTSGLYIAMGAVGVGPGDEVIVSPWTMTASAVAPIIFNAIPVFADVEPDYFCLSPESVEERISEYTKAILAVDIFGLAYDADRINRIARRHNLLVIEDAAQAPGSLYKDKYAGTLGDIGVFSLNYHKHIHCGEGGMVVTNDDKLAQRIRLIRNHAETVVEDMGMTAITDMVGFNLRQTEIGAAIGRVQLRKLAKLVAKRIENVDYINKHLSGIDFIKPAGTRSQATHAYYTHGFHFYPERAGAGITRDVFVTALRAELQPMEFRENEGPLVGQGYVKPLYYQPIYQKKIAYGRQGCPFKCPWYKGKAVYRPGLCPNAEHLHRVEFFNQGMMHANLSRSDLDDVIEAFHKVARNINQLRTDA